ncbi:hypothetical protein [Neolewinella agarilytica]|uniref:Uncharacterized protein n=1 Tax=Neolewinella agarilytica TaxID=478744 RepID=A0A1H9H8E4_9BACT|nr:hypothetical protein [Neolewinella agarilytica]SEQ58546.1 hypothetical protein SAMN05444359_11256 [Neolewinella agarilytica]
MTKAEQTQFLEAINRLIQKVDERFPAKGSSSNSQETDFSKAFSKLDKALKGECVAQEASSEAESKPEEEAPGEATSPTNTDK